MFVFLNKVTIKGGKDYDQLKMSHIISIILEFNTFRIRNDVNKLIIITIKF